MAANIGLRFPGRRSFIAGSIILILFGAIHAVATIADNFKAKDPMLKEVEAAMRTTELKSPVGSITIWNATELLGHSYSVLLIFAGITGLLVVRPMAVVGRLRAITIMNIMLCTCLVALGLVWMFPPPLAFSCLALAAFSASLMRQHLIKMPAHERAGE